MQYRFSRIRMQGMPPQSYGPKRKDKKKPVSLDVEPYGPEIAHIPRDMLKLLNT